MLLTALAVLPGACGSSTREAGGREVVVFAAASLRDALQELARGFEQETGIKVLFNFAGSNVLAQQIVAARGADLFLSASERWMDAVDEAGRLAHGTRRALLANSLVVIADAQSRWTLADPCDLAALPFKYLALADPDAVPAGHYARDWLAARACHGPSLWQQVAPRVAPAPDVRAALGLVLADPDLVAIVYTTDWLAFAEKTRVLYEVPSADGPAIRYVLAQVADAPHSDAARAFFDYLTRATARVVFERHGFIVLSHGA